MLKNLLRKIWESANNPFWIFAFVIFIPLFLCKYTTVSCEALSGFIGDVMVAFWGVSFLILIYLGINSRREFVELYKNIKEHGWKDVADKWVDDFFKGLKRMPLKLIFNILLFAFFYVMIIESYLYFSIKYIHKGIILFLAVYSLTLIYVNPGKRFKKKLSGGIKILSVAILIFLSPLSTTFEKEFLDDGEWIDAHIFSGFAAKYGKHFTETLVHKMNPLLDVDGIPNASPGSFRDTFKLYNERLEKNNLDKKLLPQKALKNERSIHSMFIKKSLDIFGDQAVAKSEKQKVMETLLDYLVCIIKKGQIETVKNDSNHPVQTRLLKRIIEYIESESLGNIPPIRLKLKNLYCALSLKTTINPYIIKKFLGEEVEPCSENQ